jgi:hypothetical protein
VMKVMGNFAYYILEYPHEGGSSAAGDPLHL